MNTCRLYYGYPTTMIAWLGVYNYDGYMQPTAARTKHTALACLTILFFVALAAFPFGAYAGYYGQDIYGADAYGGPVPDMTPPVIINTTPSNYSATTTTVSLMVSTNEVATCHYASTAGSDFASMVAFATTGSMTHATSVAVVASSSYTYYVKCQDSALNTSDDISISFTVAATPPSTLGQGLVLDYSFDTGTVSTTSVVDISGNNHSGTLLYGVATTTGKFGTGVLLNATSSIDMGTTSLGLADAYSVSFWLNLNSYNGNYIVNHLFSRGAYVYPLDMQLGSTRVVRLGNRTDKTYYLNAAGSVATSTWTNIIETYDHGTRKAYINGNTAGSDTFTPGLNWPNTIKFTIGSITPTVGDGFNGAIDEFRIYNRALSTQEVTALATGGS